MHITEVVTVGDRGRVRLDPDCRKALCIHGIDSRIRVQATVIWPESKRGQRTRFEKDIDSRGRFSVPIDARRELGIDDIGASLEFIIEVVGETTDPPF